MEEKKPEISPIVQPGEIRITIQLLPDKINPVKMTMHSRIEPETADPMLVRQMLRVLEDTIMTKFIQENKPKTPVPVNSLFGVRH